MEHRLKELQKTIGYQFQDEKKLINALTHSSYANERKWKYHRNNERLEFLGDAVLEVVSSDFIFHHHKQMSEGKMTKLRASLVCEMSLAATARELHLGQFLYLGKGEFVTGGDKRDSILADAVEAVIGAIYIDGGMEPAKQFIEKYVLSDIEKKQLFHDSKTILQEKIQSDKEKKHVISYPLIEETGPAHDKCFTVQCDIDGVTYGSGKGHTKKAAEQKAAYETIMMLNQES